MKRHALILAVGFIAVAQTPVALAFDKAPVPPITKPGPKIPPDSPGPTFPIPCAPQDPNCGPIPTDPKEPVPMFRKAIKPLINKPMILGGRKH